MLNVAIISHSAEECRFSRFQVSNLLTPALETAGAVHACLCMGGGRKWEAEAVETSLHLWTRQESFRA